MAGQVAKKCRPLVLGIILALSYCRTLSLFHGYSAPMQAYHHLPAVNATSPLPDGQDGMAFSMSRTILHIIFMISKPKFVFHSVLIY